MNVQWRPVVYLNSTAVKYPPKATRAEAWAIAESAMKRVLGSVSFGVQRVTQ